MPTQSNSIWHRAQRRYCFLCDWFLDGPCGFLLMFAVLLSPLWVICIVFSVAKLSETHFALSLSICGALLFFIIMHALLTASRERWIGEEEDTIHADTSER